MKRNSDNSIIPKIIVILGTLSIVGIILLFLRPRPELTSRAKRPESPKKLFTQVIEAAKPAVQRLWEEGDRLLPAEGPKCDTEIMHDERIGRSYYQCNPHFWQCFWEGGVKENPSLEIDLFGQTFHVTAKPSSKRRFYELWKKTSPGLDLHYGYLVELVVKELPGLSQPMLLADTCRDTYLPQRIYGYGKPKDRTEDGFLWDNIDRHIFVDKFYVTTRRINEWRILKGEPQKVESDRKKWALPAQLPLSEQKSYCAFYGKRLLEAKLLDASSMPPADLKDTRPLNVLRPDTPWQRDIGRSFLGMARINPEYQLTPLDCQLAQVKGCPETFFSTDSATWMGVHFPLGFYPESLENFIEPEKNLKKSSRYLAASSPLHVLGVHSNWKGLQEPSEAVAFRCYEEVSR